MNKNAVKNIILAQMASDGGKWLYPQFEVPDTLKADAEKAFEAGYTAKDELLERACLIVARHHDKDIHFFVTEDKEGVAKFIIYFDIKVNGKRWQASFHSFGVKRWSKWVKSTVPSRGNWDHKSSRETCIQLSKLF